MEQRAEYLGRVERPRLIVVKDDGATYSALPHAVLFDERLSCGEVVLYAVLQSHWWQGGECWASHATLARQARCSERQVQRYLKRLVMLGMIAERRRGQGQAKAYAASQHDTGVVFNPTVMSPSPANTTPVSPEHDTGVRFNTTPVSDLKKTPEDTYGSTKPEGDAANASPAPTVEKPKVKAESRATRLPADWALTEAHFQAATKRGFDSARAEVEGEKFADYHRGKGTRMLDWLAAWRTWLGNAVEFDKRRSPRPSANGTPPIPPGAASKQRSSWANFEGRHGGNVVGTRRDDGR